MSCRIQTARDKVREARRKRIEAAWGGVGGKRSIHSDDGEQPQPVTKASQLNESGKYSSASSCLTDTTSSLTTGRSSSIGVSLLCVEDEGIEPEGYEVVMTDGPPKVMLDSDYIEEKDLQLTGETLGSWHSTDETIGCWSSPSEEEVIAKHERARYERVRITAVEHSRICSEYFRKHNARSGILIPPGMENQYEVMTQYRKEIHDTRGYMVTIDPGRGLGETILPVRLNWDPKNKRDADCRFNQARFRNFAQECIKLYNNNNNKNVQEQSPYKFEKIEYVTHRCCPPRRYLFYITFQASRVDDPKSKTFQAECEYNYRGDRTTFLLCERKSVLESQWNEERGKGIPCPLPCCTKYKLPKIPSWRTELMIWTCEESIALYNKRNYQGPRYKFDKIERAAAHNYHPANTLYFITFQASLVNDSSKIETFQAECDHVFKYDSRKVVLCEKKSVLESKCKEEQAKGRTCQLSCCIMDKLIKMPL
ncbi:OLC1v1001549C1 [Oldenlandia corymbosa var. corymbosa]|uniref:OLC1v1001549C1 n=1 Tax=Oldenlandia corymbosa var. corymbosa TaxID=529605 RepID=A0AAV1D691_OLDCO|nr:OLC1v1001549C1 [Oldenlandia corymbosa var. corymbosa]